MAVDKKKVFHEIRVFALMVLIVFSLRSALADWNDVPTGSMKPTIREGDRVVVNKLAYDLKIPFTTFDIIKWGDPRRGDIVVLFSPEDGTRLVKRVVGLPGDRVSMENNRLFINDEPVAWSSIEEAEEAHGPVHILRENLAGYEHAMMLTQYAFSERRSFATQIVPDGHYYVLGDNRDDSRDSRWIGPIERSRIVGKATAVAFSLDRKRNWAPRWNRFFTALQ